MRYLEKDIQSPSLNVILLTAVLCLPGEIGWGQPRVDHVPLTHAGNSLLVATGSFLDQKGSFLLDTGCNRNFVDRMLVQDYKGETKTGHVSVSGSGKIIANALADLQIIIDGEEPHHGLAIAIDLSNINKHRTSPVIGCLGTPFLWNKYVYYTHKNQSTSFLPPKELERFTHIPLAFANGLPYVSLQVSNGDIIIAQLDTGFNGELALEENLFARLSEQRVITDVENALVSVADQDYSASRGALSDMKMGGVCFTDVKASSRKMTNQIGLGLLQRQDFAFNLSQGSLWIRSPADDVQSSRRDEDTRE